MSNNPAKYEVLIKQYLHSILDRSGAEGWNFNLQLSEPRDYQNASFWKEPTYTFKSISAIFDLTGLPVHYQDHFSELKVSQMRFSSCVWDLTYDVSSSSSSSLQVLYSMTVFIILTFSFLTISFIISPIYH